ncbi:hypothetical protein AB6D11_00175 [Vibrio splendidus]
MHSLSSAHLAALLLHSTRQNEIIPSLLTLKKATQLANIERAKIVCPKATAAHWHAALKLINSQIDHLNTTRA